jgi:hypothetical protein
MVALRGIHCGDHALDCMGVFVDECGQKSVEEL